LHGYRDGVNEQRLPDPALVVLVGASGSGKSTWCESRYRREEIVSSDALRGVLGSGPHDLDASEDAFEVLEKVVAARVDRGLTTVVDTLGLDVERRQRWLALAKAAALPAVAVLFDVPERECRRRNAARARPVPAPALTAQLRRVRDLAPTLAEEGWDLVVEYDDSTEPVPPVSTPATRPANVDADRRSSQGLRVMLQLSRFPWGEDPAAWLREMALAADEAGFAGLALMDHLIQIPQVDRAWEPIPEPWVSLGLLAGLDTRLQLGTLVTPATFRPPGITAKAAATLDALSGGRAFVGIGAGWWAREHAAYGLPFPSAGERLDLLERAIETMRALWAPGTKGYDGDTVTLPETTSYPRPKNGIPIIVGGGGERRTLRIAARLGDACNLPSDPATLDAKLAVLRRHSDEVGRDPSEVEVTVLDLPIIGRDRDDTWRRVEQLRGRTAAATFAARHHAGTVDDQRQRYAQLAERGVGTVFVALPDLDRPDDILALSRLTE
jgi:alkanesulfonate monooxygenase SsuD/methylene tetrahydromethanopterin reductase-like flavin-dependent oxidoreductase (luciferase family)/predicted kinase